VDNFFLFAKATNSDGDVSKIESRKEDWWVLLARKIQLVGSPQQSNSIVGSNSRRGLLLPDVSFNRKLSILQ